MVFVLVISDITSEVLYRNILVPVLICHVQFGIMLLVECCEARLGFSFDIHPVLVEVMLPVECYKRVSRIQLFL